MNVNEPKRSSTASSAATAPARFSSEEADNHLSELVRRLRWLVADSPERQAKIEGLMRAYASGNLQVDAEATASAIIDDAMVPHSKFR